MAADSSSSGPPEPAPAPVATATTPKRKGPSAGQVLVVTSVMFTFISFWRTAAIVLCDLASTAYYIGGIVESQIGKAAPWFILAVMLFSYARAERLHRELLDVRPRRRLPHRQGGDGRRAGPAGGLGPACSTTS